MNYEDLINCIIEQGSDPCIIETEEDATEWLDVIENASIVLEITDPEEYQIAKRKLKLENATTNKIYSFVNGSEGTYCLSEDWGYWPLQSKK